MPRTATSSVRIPTAPSAVSYRWLALALVAAASFRLLWPSDTSFLFDQGLLIDRALTDNARHALTTFGLRGTRGLDYGPLAIWFYRVLLWVKTDLVTLVVVRTALVTAVTGGSVFWLSRLCPFLVPEVAVVPLLSPYLWYFARDPWDNSLMIPLVSLAFTAYFAFHLQRKAWQLAIVALCLAGCFLTHLMSLALTAALGLHFLVFHLDWAKRKLGALALIVGVTLVVMAPYLGHLAQHWQQAGPPPIGKVAAIGFSFCGAVQFSAIGFERYLGKMWFATPGAPAVVSALSGIATFLTALAYVFGWYGLYVAVHRILRGGLRDARYHLCWLTVAGFAFHFMLNCAMHLFSYPHYYNGVWILFLLQIWIGVSELWKGSAGRIAFFAYSASLAISLAHVALLIHVNGGSRELSYGPTLGNWITLARELNAAPAGNTVVSNAFHPRIFPNVLPTLQRIYQPQEKDRATFGDYRGPLVLQYLDPLNPRDGRIVLTKGGERPSPSVDENGPRTR